MIDLDKRSVEVTVNVDLFVPSSLQFVHFNSKINAIVIVTAAIVTILVFILVMLVVVVALAGSGVVRG